MPGGGPAEVSMNTSASTRSGCAEHDPARRPSRPSSGRAAAGRAGRCASATASDVGGEPVERVGARGRRAASLSPWPRWSNVTTRWSTRERVDVVGEVLLGPAESRAPGAAPGASAGARDDGREAHAVVGRCHRALAANLRPERTAGERTRNMREWRLPRRLARATGRRHLQALGSRQARPPDRRQRRAPGVPDHQDPRRRHPAEGHPRRHAGVPRRRRSRSPSSASCSRPGAGSGCSRCSTSTSRSAPCSAHYLAGQFVATCCRRRSAATSCASAGRRRPPAPATSRSRRWSIERLTGFVALPLLTLLGFALEPSLLDVAARVDRARSSPAPPSSPSS